MTYKIAYTAHREKGCDDYVYRLFTRIQAVHSDTLTAISIAHKTHRDFHHKSNNPNVVAITAGRLAQYR